MNRLEEAVDLIQAELGEGFEVKIHQVEKVNGTVKTGIFIHKDGCTICPVTYPDPDLQDPNEIAEDIKAKYEASMAHVSSDSLEGKTKDQIRELVLQTVKPCLIGLEKNRSLIENQELPVKYFLDMAVVYRFFVAHFSDESAGTALIKKPLLDALDIDFEELDSAAMKNLEKDGYEYGNLADLAASIGVVPDTDDDAPMLYLTSAPVRAYGAAQLLNQKALDEVGRVFGGRFLIIPSSIHEVLAIPACNDLEALSDMVRTINSFGSVVSPDEVLTNTLYEYDVRKGKVEIAMKGR